MRSAARVLEQWGQASGLVGLLEFEELLVLSLSAFLALRALPSHSVLVWTVVALDV